MKIEKHFISAEIGSEQWIRWQSIGQAGREVVVTFGEETARGMVTMVTTDFGDGGASVVIQTTGPGWYIRAS
jgi:hypothetical protein